MAKASRKQTNAKTSNQLRIIGGQWRGRKLNFPSIEGLRPTTDRVRETLFNWLTPHIVDARCLDLFSGSGALGLEALSRGAAFADLVDASPVVCQQLTQNLQTLQCTKAKVWNNPAQAWLEQAQPSYDVIFLDPPFGKDLAASCIQLIDSQQLLNNAPNATSWVYLEMATQDPLPIIPTHWHLHREKTAGQVSYRLYKVEQV